jgi:hypothetical protein
MNKYRFALQNSGTVIEELGVMALPNDDEALAFGQQVAQDLADDQDQQAGVAVAVIKGARTVRSIPVK